MLACFHCPFICSYIAFLFFLSSTNAALIRSRLAWNLSSCTRVLMFPRCLHLQSCIVYSTPKIVFPWQKAQVVFEIKSDRWHLGAQEGIQWVECLTFVDQLAAPHMGKGFGKRGM